VTFDEIFSLPNGASFVRADLHVHSVGGSYDVTDVALTPDDIIKASIERNLSVVSITDHNSIANVRAALAAAQPHKATLLCVPGVEVTTPQGHLLCYFESIEKLESFFYGLKVVTDQQESRTVSSMPDVILSAGALGGLCVAAHIDTKIGFEVGADGYPAWKRDIVCHPGLLGLEFREASNQAWYSPEEPTGEPNAANRRHLATQRSQAKDIPAAGLLARLQGSDAHTLDDFRNSTDTTRVKLSELSFGSLRNAFLDSEARIRIDAALPNAIAKIIGLSVDGGFLSTVNVHFSPNLNCLFGGRGTGKSTLVKAIPYALGANIPNTDGLFESVTVYCEDATGVQYRFDHSAGQAPLARIRRPDGATVPVDGDAFTGEYFGHGELGEVAKRSLLVSAALQQFLDKHISFGGLLER